MGLWAYGYGHEIGSDPGLWTEFSPDHAFAYVLDLLHGPGSGRVFEFDLPVLRDSGCQLIDRLLARHPFLLRHHLWLQPRFRLTRSTLRSAGK